MIGVEFDEGHLPTVHPDTFSLTQPCQFLAAEQTDACFTFGLGLANSLPR